MVDDTTDHPHFFADFYKWENGEHEFPEGLRQRESKPGCAKMQSQLRMRQATYMNEIHNKEKAPTHHLASPMSSHLKKNLRERPKKAKQK